MKHKIIIAFSTISRNWDDRVVGNVPPGTRNHVFDTSNAMNTTYAALSNGCYTQQNIRFLIMANVAIYQQIWSTEPINQMVILWVHRYMDFFQDAMGACVTYLLLLEENRERLCGQCLLKDIEIKLHGTLSVQTLNHHEALSYKHKRSQCTLQWRHNERDVVSNNRRLDCLQSRSFRCISKKTSKLRVTGLCAGNSPVTGEFPAQRAVTRKMFLTLFDDVIIRNLHPP